MYKDKSANLTENIGSHQTTTFIILEILAGGYMQTANINSKIKLERNGDSFVIGYNRPQTFKSFVINRSSITLIITVQINSIDSRN